MSKFLKPLLLTPLLLLIAVLLQADEKSESFSPYADAKGGMRLPAGLRSAWVHLGTWLMTAPLPPGTAGEKTAPDPGFHNVYTQAAALKAYKKNGQWPDGAVIIMEIRKIEWDDEPTGHVMAEGAPVEWFMMIKDENGRFPGNPNWGSGWGWALFTPGQPKTNASSGYKQDCLGCHEAAGGTDLIFLKGYPVLRSDSNSLSHPDPGSVQGSG